MEGNVVKVLVTGATGRVGANVVRSLVASGIECRAMTAVADPLRDKLDQFEGLEVIEADLRDQPAINKACEGITHVAHLAAQLVRGNTPVDVFYDVNALGTLRLLEGLVRTGQPDGRFVLVSSDGTYRAGSPPAVPLTEDAKQVPADYYGTSKLLGEVVLRNHASQFDIPHSIVRFATVISPEESPNVFRLGFWRTVFEWQEMGKDSHLWPLFDGQPDLVRILDEQAGQAPLDTAAGIVGPGGRPWTLSMVDVRDAAAGVIAALTHPDADGHAFNIAASAPTSHDEGARVIAESYGVPELLIEMPMMHNLELDITTARETLGYQPKFDYRGMVQSAQALATGRDTNGSPFIPARSASGVASAQQ